MPQNGVRCDECGREMSMATTGSNGVVLTNVFTGAEKTVCPDHAQVLLAMRNRENVPIWERATAGGGSESFGISG